MSEGKGICNDCGLPIAMDSENFSCTRSLRVKVEQLEREVAELRERAERANALYDSTRKQLAISSSDREKALEQEIAELESNYFELNNDLAIANSMLSASLAAQSAAREIVQQWADKSGHDKCWYYPELFNQLVAVFGVDVQPPYISRQEFEQGCSRFQDELFAAEEAEQSADDESGNQIEP